MNSLSIKLYHRSAISCARKPRFFVLMRKITCSITKHEIANDAFELCFIRVICSCQLHFHAHAQHVCKHRILERHSSSVTFSVATFPGTHFNSSNNPLRALHCCPLNYLRRFPQLQVAGTNVL